METIAIPDFSGYYKLNLIMHTQSQKCPAREGSHTPDLSAKKEQVSAYVIPRNLVKLST